MRYETQEARAPSCKEAVETKLEGYRHRDLERVAAKLEQQGVEVEEVTQDAVARAITEIDDEAVLHPAYQQAG